MLALYIVINYRITAYNYTKITIPMAISSKSNKQLTQL